MIQVRCSDDSVKVGGDFSAALAFVKAQPGRRYDAAAKVWIVPVASRDLLRAASASHLPVELPGGGHQTRYGNGYSADEWQALRREQEVNRAAEKAVAAVAGDAIAQLRADLAELMPQATAKQIDYLVGLITDEDGGLDAAEMAGRIQFSSPARKAALIAIADRYYGRLNQADAVFQAAREAAMDQD